MVVNQERFHLKGLGQNITDDDLQKFCARLGNVCELYRPASLTATNLPKDFAIVKVEGDSEARAKAAKALHGSLWKGCKIRISKAKEYYKDRLSRERSELEEKLCTTSAPPSSNEIKNFQAVTIRVRKGRGLPAIRIAASPLLVVNGSLYEPSSIGTARAAKKTLFDIDAELLPLKGYTKLTTTGLSVSQSVSDERMEAASATNTKMVSGKGVRKGFGTLMQVDCCIEDESDLKHLSNGSVNGEGNDENYPVTEEILAKEKERSLSILSKMMNPVPQEHAEPKLDIVENQRKTTENQENVFVNIKEMKNIFSKSGGVWWNDGTIERRGEAANDIIFAEAERQGFDIRSDPQDAFNEKKRTFTLFSSENDQHDDQEKTNKSKSMKLATDPTDGSNRGILLHFDKTAVSQLATEFYCNRDIDNVLQEWRESRETKMKLFKQRRRDFSRQVSKR